jgi:hypothetical protein
MGIVGLILRSRWSQEFRIAVIILCLIALTAELLPEVEAKLIVVPALIFAIFLLVLELKK